MGTQGAPGSPSPAALSWGLPSVCSSHQPRTFVLSCPFQVLWETWTGGTWLPPQSHILLPSPTEGDGQAKFLDSPWHFSPGSVPINQGRLCGMLLLGARMRCGPFGPPLWTLSQVRFGRLGARERHAWRQMRAAVLGEAATLTGL